MKNLFYNFINKVQKKFGWSKKNDRLERGQILVIVALSVIALTAIVGLAIDTGLLYLNHGKLRRAVDAAALAATSQFRERYGPADLAKAAKEFLVLNGINDPTAIVETCETNPGDAVLCTFPARKLVRVRATEVINLAFLPVIGIHTATISAEAVSEAASMDVVLLIDSSDSMTSDAPPGDAMRDPAQCNLIHECHPFEEVKDAAKAFVERLYIPYDRVAIVTFAERGQIVFSFADFDAQPTTAAKKAAVLNTIENIGVFDPGDCLHYDGIGTCRDYERDATGTSYVDLDGNGFGDVYYGFDCPVYHTTSNPDTCGTTSTGHGLLIAGDEFANEDTFRQEALWVVILLTDGATNGPDYACPNNTWTSPFCRDLSATTRHCFEADDTSCLNGSGKVYDPNGVYWPDRYDSDDYARDMADFVADDQDALIFTIGLGDLVTTSPPFVWSADEGRDLGAGEQLLRYAADIGRGNYYFAPTGIELEAIFLDIAGNLATRLTQ